jgi:hypothetical protein
MLRRYVSQREQLLSSRRVEEIEDLLSFAVTFNLEFEKEESRKQLSDFFWNTFERYAGEGCPPRCDLLVRLIRSFTGAGLKPDLTIPQKHVFFGLRRWRRALRGSPLLKFGRPSEAELRTFRKLSRAEQEELQKMIELADIMGIYADDLKRFLSAPE